jgi:hypothetical protein
MSARPVVKTSTMNPAMTEAAISAAQVISPWSFFYNLNNSHDLEFNYLKGCHR